MEQEIKIRAQDKKVIEGILRGSIKKPLIVLVHGLCGNMNEALHYNAARYFEKQGFSSFRFNLYGWNKNNRKLHECTLKTHGMDINTVINYLQKKGTKKIFIVGHSYGFPSILVSKNRNFKAIVSWDGSDLPRNRFSKLKKVISLHGRILDEGYYTIMGEAMVQEEQKVNSVKMLKSQKKPVKFITILGNTGNASGAKQMFKASPKPKAIRIIPGATHNFTEDGKQAELYKETISWFKKFSN